MAKLNWDKCKKSYQTPDHLKGPRSSKKIRPMRNRKEATQKQIDFLKELGGNIPEEMSIKQAANLIAYRLETRKDGKEVRLTKIVGGGRPEHLDEEL